MSETKEPEQPDEKKDIKKQEEQFINTLADGVLTGKPLYLVPFDNIDDVISRIERMKKRVVRKGDYKQAQHMEDSIRKLQSYRLTSNFKNFKEQQSYEIESRKQELEEERENEQLQNDSTLQRFLAQKDAERQEIIKKYQKQLEKFEAENSEIPAKFRKFSNEYLILQEKENHLIRSKRYAEANDVKILRDKQLIKEQENQMNEWNKYINKQKDTMEKQLQKTLKCHDEKTEVQFLELKAASDMSIGNIKRAINMKNVKMAITNSDDLTPITRQETIKSRMLMNKTQITSNRMKRIRKVSYSLAASQRLTRSFPSAIRTPQFRKKNMSELF